MTHTAAIKATMALLAVACMSTPAAAQTSGRSSVLPLHVEASFGMGTQSKGVTPFGTVVDLNYGFAKNLSLHAVTEAYYFIPKNGSVSSYNDSFNLGGGLGWTFAPDDHMGDMELRATVTAPVGGKAYKHAAYNVGVYWYGAPTSRRVVPMVSVGYTHKNFTAKGMPNYNGAYVTLGVRF